MPDARAQASRVPSRIVQVVDETKLTRLQGNTYPLARPEFDRGAVPPSLPLQRMLLVLKRSPEQEAALDELLDERQNKASPNYHRWLTPEQFGQQFGPSDQDIQAVTSWLQSHGFQVARVAKGRTVIEFSGTAGQVQGAFHTEMHQFMVNGEEHLANASDPQIPTALAPVVTGVVSLHDFRPQSHLRRVGAFHRSQTGQVEPLFTPPGSTQFFPLVPGDFAKIYNVQPLWDAGINGTGQTIAIVGESNIHVSDIQGFRSLFGLPNNFTSANVILDGPDPGILPDETEADLDVEWSGAVAKNATVMYVVSAPTETTSGVHLSSVYIVDNNLAGVMSESFGECEQSLGSAGNQFYNSLWGQAAAQGITVILSSGDGGSAGCDNFNTQQAATRGLAVSGFASTPFNVSVGGTDFDQINSWSQYWNATDDPITQASARGYIPEIPWNDSCGQLGVNGCGPTAPNGSLNIIAGSGGPSTIYSKPSWQTGVPGMPTDGRRDLPDVSLFASNGFTGSIYIICQADVTNPPETSCNLTNFGFTFQGVGGTSAAAPAFAGIMALVNQKLASAQSPVPRQGNANYVLYALAKKAGALCPSTANPASTCTFYDVTHGNSALANSSVGNNAVPCTGGTPNCSSGSASVHGVLVDSKNNPAWTTNAGFDMATGLGSVNVQNLVNNWASLTFLPSMTTLSASIDGKPVNSISGLSHGQPINVVTTVAAGSGAAGTPEGQVALVASPNPASGSPSPSLGIEGLPLSNGTATAANVVLPGGIYNLTAHYPGDGTFGPSDSSPAIPVNVSAENSKTLISIPTFDPATGTETGNAPASLAYGSPYIARIDVGNTQATLSFPQQPLCNPPNCPSGTISWTDSYNGGAPAPLDGGKFTLNSAGFTEDFSIQLPGGSHQLAATYSGDSSYNVSSSTYSLSVTRAPTTTLAGNPPLPPQSVTPFFLNAIVRTNSSGAMPSCNVTFFEGSTPVPGTLTCTGQAGGATFGAFLQPSLLVSQTTSGTHTYTAMFNGDSNYGPSTSAPMTTQVFYGTNTTLSVSPSVVQYGSSVTLIAMVDTFLTQGPAIPNTVSFHSGPTPVSGTVSYMPIKDASGNLALQATLTATPQLTTDYYATFAGDANYFMSSSQNVVVTVNIPGFSLTANPMNLSVTAGQSGVATVTVTPASNATSPVTLSCYNVTVPAGATCSFSPSTVTLSNGNTATATLTLTTLPPSASPTTSLAPLKPPTLFALFHGRWGLAILAALLTLILPVRLHGLRRYRVAIGLASACVFGLLIGCGGGSGGGGGVGPVATSISLTTSGTKVPNTAPPTFEAKVSSSRTLSGSVTFFDQGAVLGVVSVLADGTATLQAVGLSIGTHVITASYSGDANNLPSKTSGSLNQVITGTAPLLINGTTGGLTNQTSLLLTIQ